MPRAKVPFRKDDATPHERRWLNRLEKVRPDMRPLIVVNQHRRADGSFDSLIRNRPGRLSGCYVVDLAWVIKETRRLERQRCRAVVRDIQNHIGAFI